jgi:hypothetical protein
MYKFKVRVFLAYMLPHSYIHTIFIIEWGRTLCLNIHLYIYTSTHPFELTTANAKQGTDTNRMHSFHAHLSFTHLFTHLFTHSKSDANRLFSLPFPQADAEAAKLSDEISMTPLAKDPVSII